MSEILYLVIAIFCATFATYLTRVLPFLLFRNFKNGGILEYLQKNMPLAILTLLLFYSLKDADFSYYFAYKEILSILLVMGSFLIFKNPLLSIFSGVGLYMFLLRL
ncbi:hypothetical protein CCZ01_04445 [Helicobacter monodelphidis]|uniref:branched-chain amino acid transporter permease n=1 Tax=Helicobacter sp. 15-1451 TaxID=2004995 RepID=UPI000DCB4B4D|nr:AzlD domain-containing protein [Helicobacter sp. 15-1451]RAX57883.1 hypothetical protein CCZ01_04445 [Helicobacter sp. 15-1451]